MRSKPRSLRAARERAGHTQTSLAPLVGVSNQRLSQLELASEGVHPTTAKRIADVLGVDIEDIATVDEAVAS